MGKQNARRDAKRDGYTKSKLTLDTGAEVVVAIHWKDALRYMHDANESKPPKMEWEADS